MIEDNVNWTTMCMLVVNRGKGNTTGSSTSLESENIHLLYYAGISHNVRTMFSRLATKKGFNAYNGYG